MIFAANSAKSVSKTPKNAKSRRSSKQMVELSGAHVIIKKRKN